MYKPKTYTKYSKNNQGITLIELLVVMVLLIVLAVAVLGLQYILGQNRQVAIDNFYNVDRANVNVTALTKEIRNARISGSGAYPIESAGDNQLVFFSDIDFDGDIERVRYTLISTNLEKGVVEPVGQPITYPLANEKTKIITDIVRNQGTPLFTYYNGDWPVDTVNNPLATPPSLSQIKLIKIYLQINVDDSEPQNDYILEPITNIRMLKENL